MKNSTDLQLTNLFVEGCSEAFEELLHRYGRITYHYILGKVKQRSLADDIFQETCIKIMTVLKRGGYVDKGKFEAWIMRITRNQVIDYFRKQRTCDILIDDNTTFDNFSRNIIHNETTIPILGDKVTSELRKLICLLPTEQREVLFMRYYMGLTHREVAEHLKIGLNTALGRMRYAIINIRKMINKDKNSRLKGSLVA
ncbi:MAG: RNA polymerase sigma factor [Bacteroidales bacterium]